MLKDSGYAFYRIEPSGFHKADRLAAPHAHAKSDFNYLVTVRTPEEVANLYAQCRSRIESLDQTNLVASSDKKERVT